MFLRGSSHALAEPMILRSERGAIIIHVALALVVLILFTGFVIDQGAMLVARGQAQAAADAGALAGAISLRDAPTNYVLASQTATQLASTNWIAGQQTAPAHIVVSPLPYTCPAGLGAGAPACIRVDVFRGLPDRAGNTHNNTMPTIIMNMVGIANQGVRATATAMVGAGNMVSCIKPWAVVDKWNDNSTGAAGGTTPSAWDQMDRFDPGVDSYVPGSSGFTASGANNDIGLQLMLKGDGSEFSSGWSMRVELGGGNGSATYRDEIQGCPSWVPDIGFYDGPEPCRTRTDQNFPAGCINVRPGVAQGPTVKQGVDALIALDRSASWDVANKTIVGGCTATGTCSSIHPDGLSYSPRVIPLALFNPQACVNSSCSSGNNTVAQVTNIMGFFLEGTCDDVFSTPPAWCGTGGQPGKTVVGRIMKYPGTNSGVSGAAGPSSFITVMMLKR